MASSLGAITADREALVRVSQRGVEMHESPPWQRTQGSNAFLIQLTSNAHKSNPSPIKTANVCVSDFDCCHY